MKTKHQKQLNLPIDGGQVVTRRITVALSLVVALVLLATVCACTLPGQDSVYWPAEEWRTSTPQKQDMDPTLLQEMVDLIDEQDLAYHSVLVVRHGHLVLEEYRDEYDRDTKHHLQSTTKSFSSMLIGIALHQGFLDDVDQKLVDLFPSHTIANLDARKQRITLEHLLTMSDGMNWHELDYPYTDSRNSLGKMWVSNDAVQHVLDQPMAREPGESWSYNSGTSILLGGILEETTGRDVLAFARETLFGPLGIDDVYWQMTTGNHYHTDGGLYLTPRAMARFGFLMLRDGQWDSKQIVSPEWVARSTQAHYQTGPQRGYGYQWWTLDNGIFASRGHYEQNIYVVPEADMVVVFTGSIPDDMIPPTDGLLYRYILPACTDLPQGATLLTYADKGITFEYERGFSVQELDLSNQVAEPNETALIQFLSVAYPLELIQVTITQTEPEPDLEASLAAYYEVGSQEPGVEVSTGDSHPFTFDEHQAIFQPFDYYIEEGLQLKGVTVAWHCLESQRVLFFTYLTNPQISDQDLKDRLQEHLDRFHCHAVD